MCSEFDTDIMWDRIERLEQAVLALTADPANPRTAAAAARLQLGPIETPPLKA